MPGISNVFTRFFRDISHLVYPDNCIVCERELSELEADICSFCDQNITKTNFHLFKEPTDLDKLFWGRCKLEFTHSHMFFKKDGASQDVLFSLKYKNNPALGVHFGNRIGKELKQIELFDAVDGIIPVPLHPKKKFIRGYNQSETIAKGISDTTEKKLFTKLIQRTKHTETQTKKSRFERWDNVDKVFKVSPEIKKLKHIVIVDDVITTGSTIENIIQIIKAEHTEIKVSVVTLAIA